MCPAAGDDSVGRPGICEASPALQNARQTLVLFPSSSGRTSPRGWFAASCLLLGLTSGFTFLQPFCIQSVLTLCTTCCNEFHTDIFWKHFMCLALCRWPETPSNKAQHPPVPLWTYIMVGKEMLNQKRASTKFVRCKEAQRVYVLVYMGTYMSAFRKSGWGRPK